MPNKIPNMRCEIWWTTPAGDLDRCLPLLDDTERTRVVRQHREIDRLRFATGRVLVKSVAAKWLGVAPQDVVLAVECDTCGSALHGKPRLREPASGVEISITHSGRRVGVALAEGGPVGIDVEKESNVTEPNLLEPYVLARTERESLNEMTGEPRSRAFLRYWTRKEAILKASGAGLTTPMTRCLVSGPDEHARALSVPGFPPAGSSLHLVDLAPGGGYIGAVAVAVPGPVEVSENFWDRSELFGSLGSHL